EESIESRDEAFAARLLRQLLARPGDEDAEAGTGADEPLPFELGVDAGDGVRIVGELAGQLADRGEFLCLRQPAAGGSLVNWPHALTIDRLATGGFDAEVHDGVPTVLVVLVQSVERRVKLEIGEKWSEKERMRIVAARRRSAFLVDPSRSRQNGA